MWNDDHFLAKEYNRRLVEISWRERQLKEMRSEQSVEQPAFRRYMMLRMGDSLISLGQRLRKAGEISQPVDLKRECV